METLIAATVAMIKATHKHITATIMMRFGCAAGLFTVPDLPQAAGQASFTRHITLTPSCPPPEDSLPSIRNVRRDVVQNPVREDPGRRVRSLANNCEPPRSA